MTELLWYKYSITFTNQWTSELIVRHSTCHIVSVPLFGHFAYIHGVTYISANLTVTLQGRYYSPMCGSGLRVRELSWVKHPGAEIPASPVWPQTLCSLLLTTPSKTSHHDFLIRVSHCVSNHGKCRKIKALSLLREMKIELGRDDYMRKNRGQ